jgi:hypothetical protein
MMDAEARSRTCVWARVRRPKTGGARNMTVRRAMPLRETSGYTLALIFLEGFRGSSMEDGN